MNKKRAFSFLLAGAACMTGLLTSFPLIAGVLTGIGIEWLADLLAEQREALSRAMSGGKNELNHDIARTLAAAFHEALAPKKLVEDYKQTAGYYRIKQDDPAEAWRVVQTLREIADGSEQFAQQPVADIEKAFDSGIVPATILRDDAQTGPDSFVNFINAFYDGPDNTLIPWLVQRLSYARIQAHFIEQLKHDTPAFRALTLRLYASITALLHQSNAELKQHISAEVERVLTEISQRLAPQVLPAAIDRLNDMPVGSADALPPVHWLPPNSRLVEAHDPAFIGRHDLLRQIAAALQPLNAIVVLSGSGGLGKSKLANEFAHRYGAFFAGGVFWLNAGDPAQLEDELLACHGLSDLPPAAYVALDRPQQVAVITRALQSDLPRLLIVDDVQANDWRAIRAQLPKTGGCRVLVTARSSDWSAPAVRHIPVGPLSAAESRAILQQLYAALSDADAARVAETLGNHPLALHLVGRYFALTQRTADDFLRGYAQRNIDHLALRDLDTQTSIIAKLFDINWAWLETAGARGLLARTLLAHVADFAAGTPVPRALLHQTLRQRPLPPTIAADPEELDDWLALAERAGLQAGLLDAVDGGFQMHRLVADFVQKIAHDAVARAAVEQTLATAIYERNGAGDLVTLRQWRPHLLHVSERALAGAESALATTTATDDGTDLALVLATNVAYYLQADGNYAAAAQLFRRVLVMRTDPRAAAVPAVSSQAAVATALNNLGSVLKRQDQHAEAQPLLERALAIRSGLYGPDHPETAIVLNNLADLLLTAGDAPAALPLFEKALAISEQSAGPDAIATASALANLGVCFFVLRRYAAARAHYERALAVREQQLGRDHPATALVLVNLAVLLHTLGASSAARARLEQALAIQLGARGALHAETAATRYSLALLLNETGDRAAARDMLMKAAEAWEKLFGPDDRRSRQARAMLAQIDQS